MTESVVNWMNGNPHLAILVVPVFAFLEATIGIGILVSGAILLTLSSILYSNGVADLYQILPLAFFSALAADHVGFFVGRSIGPRIRRARLLQKHQAKIERAESLVQRFGEAAVVAGRLVTAIRSIVPMTCGMAGMPVYRFSMVNLLACVIWTTGLGLLVVGIDSFL